MMEAMIDDLCEYSLEDIERAFKDWRRESDKIPTTAALRKLIQLYRKSRNQNAVGWKPEVTYTQVIRERKQNWDGDILAEYPDGYHKSPIALEEEFRPKHVHISYKRDQK